uniref:Uncharacterized protein n=1 Tax=Oryza punctata TaxID=4537 RepID=A0A0E0KCT1_ORYPU
MEYSEWFGALGELGVWASTYWAYAYEQKVNSTLIIALSIDQAARSQTDCIRGSVPPVLGFGFNSKAINPVNRLTDEPTMHFPSTQILKHCRFHIPAVADKSIYNSAFNSSNSPPDKQEDRNTVASAVVSDRTDSTFAIRTNDSRASEPGSPVSSVFHMTVFGDGIMSNTLRACVVTSGQATARSTGYSLANADATNVSAA